MTYADGVMDLEEGQPIRYYVHQAQKMREQEKVTMYIDFSHLSSFPHDDPEFMRNIVQQYYRHEPSLRQGLVKFMQELSGGDGQSMKKSMYWYLMLFRKSCNAHVESWIIDQNQYVRLKMQQVLFAKFNVSKNGY